MPSTTTVRPERMPTGRGFSDCGARAPGKSPSWKEENLDVEDETGMETARVVEGIADGVAAMKGAPVTVGIGVSTGVGIGASERFPREDEEEDGIFAFAIMWILM